jgi:glycosyltransferase involved in cell wall biosynthesis
MMSHSTEKKFQVLCISGWYPSLTDPTLALFAPRHFKALGRCLSLRVFYAVKDNALCGEKNKVVQEKKQENYEEIICYYKAPETGLAPVDKVLEQLLKIYHQWKETRRLLREQTAHAFLYYVSQNNSAVAVLHSYLYEIPFATLEHWSGFLPQAQKHFRHLPLFYRWSWQWAYQRAKGVFAVSAYLQEQLQTLGKGSQALHTVVPNAVDDSVFYYSPQTLPRDFTITLITRRAYEKNLEDSLEALERLRRLGVALRVHLVGMDREELPLEGTHPLQSHLHCWGHLPGEKIGELLRNSHLSVVYSRYETFGCVIIESLACGTPVLVSDRVPMQDFIAQGVNGWKVKPEDPEALCQALLACSQGQYLWDRAKISRDCHACYGLEPVGRQLCQALQTLV